MVIFDTLTYQNETDAKYQLIAAKMMPIDHQEIKENFTIDEPETITVMGQVFEKITPLNASDKPILIYNKTLNFSSGIKWVVCISYDFFSTSRSTGVVVLLANGNTTWLSPPSKFWNKHIKPNKDLVYYQLVSDWQELPTE